MTHTEVKIGQIWADNDPRFQNDDRHLQVIEIGQGMAFCIIVKHYKPKMLGRKSAIKLSRFRPTSTGYRLVAERF